MHLPTWNWLPLLWLPSFQDFLSHHFRTSNLVVLQHTTSAPMPLSQALEKRAHHKNEPTTFTDEKLSKRTRKQSTRRPILSEVAFVNLPPVEFHSSFPPAGAYSFPRPPADLRSLHIVSKTRLSIPHLPEGGGGGQFFKCILQGRKLFWH